MIISGMEKQKRYKHVSDDDKLLVSEWTSTETVERPDNITNKDKKDVDATTLDHTYDNNNSVPTNLTDFITKSTAFFNNIRFVKNVLTTFTGANTDNTAEQMAQAMYNKIYPIGSLYWSSSPTNPQTLFGGTWTQVKDKFILAAGDTYQAGTSGGSASYTPGGTVNDRSITLQVANIPKHAHSISARTVNTGSSGGHSHTYTYPNWVKGAEGSGAKMEVGKTKSYGTWDTGGTGNHSHDVTIPAHNTNESGSGTAFSHDHPFTGTPATILPPYIAYYCWERTA
jgi:hypothetical protein